ncbi:hypothetical protein RJ55_06759 [Drechmeria coniospora]|nr:hypothetical protein RJ55_06759 [Drechmeria coniospora]
MTLLGYFLPPAAPNGERTGVLNLPAVGTAARINSCIARLPSTPVPEGEKKQGPFRASVGLNVGGHLGPVQLRRHVGCIQERSKGRRMHVDSRQGASRGMRTAFVLVALANIRATIRRGRSPHVGPFPSCGEPTGTDASRRSKCPTPAVTSHSGGQAQLAWAESEVGSGARTSVPEHMQAPLRSWEPVRISHISDLFDLSLPFPTRLAKDIPELRFWGGISSSKGDIGDSRHTAVDPLTRSSMGLASTDHQAMVAEHPSPFPRRLSMGG